MKDIFDNDWIKANKPWREYPIGTKARELGSGGYWIKNKLGWKWCTGATFPTPGAADQVCLPVESIMPDNK
jgi:hypothetical protein